MESGDYDALLPTPSRRGSPVRADDIDFSAASGQLPREALDRNLLAPEVRWVVGGDLQYASD